MAKIEIFPTDQTNPMATMLSHAERAKDAVSALVMTEHSDGSMRLSFSNISHIELAGHGALITDFALNLLKKE